MMLEQFFNEYSDRRFLFVAPGGNKGDHLIWAGGRKLADSLDLDYDWFRFKPKKQTPRVEKDVVIYVHGCGGFKLDTPWIFELLRRLRKYNPDNLLVVGPSTVCLDEKFLEDMLRDVRVDYFFTRDLSSYEVMKRFEGDFVGDVYVDEDEALNLELGDGYLEQITKMYPNELSMGYNLLSLRETDLEKTFVKIDYSKYDVVNPEPFYGNRWGWWHYKAKSITSNRLHSALLGNLLGKTCYLVKGRWHKQRSVWKYSLKKRGVNWLQV